MKKATISPVTARLAKPVYMHVLMTNLASLLRWGGMRLFEADVAMILDCGCLAVDNRGFNWGLKPAEKSGDVF